MTWPPLNGVLASFHWIHGFSQMKVSWVSIHMKVKESEVAQLCLALCNPMDCSLPGFSIHGIFQARILEWVAISFSIGGCQLGVSVKVRAGLFYPTILLVSSCSSLFLSLELCLAMCSRITLNFISLNHLQFYIFLSLHAVNILGSFSQVCLLYRFLICWLSIH